MAAAALTPTVVQKTYVPSIGITGTPMRLVKYVFKVTKVTIADWIITADHFQAGTPIRYSANTFDGSNDGAAEDIMTYTSAGTKLVLADAVVGTTYGEVWYEE